jgi:ABC-2 type transport system ATP-binding protein
LTAQENLEIWGRLYGINGSKLNSQIDFLFEMFGLTERKNDLVGGFSKGMKQKVSIARALIHEPEILFLDEPTAGLDPEASEDVVQYIKKYTKDSQKTVFLCSHRLEEVEYLCDSVAIIHNGKVLASGSIEELDKQLWQETRFSIKLENINQNFLEALQKEKYINQFIINNNELKISFKERKNVSNVIKVLVNLGADILEVKEEKRTLKDIYLSVIPKLA